MSAQPSAAGEGFTLVCGTGDVEVGTAARAEVDGRVVALVRDADGGWHCVDDRCTHADVSLAEGEVDGCTLECWLHGSRFDLRTGEPSGPPATVPVTVHEVRVDGDDVLVRLTATAR